MAEPQTDRAWQTLEKVVTASLDEQRRSRRWSNLFKGLTFLYLFVALWLFWPRAQVPLTGESYVGMVRVDGPIADGEAASADNIAQGLRKAFEDERARAVLLSINSPGGSPVQAGYVYNEIRRLRAKYPDKKLYAVIRDIGASGAYYIAAAADDIYADQASLVGSIGVISASFGFTELMEKIGVERRLFISGENKAMLDPFSPLQANQQALWQTVLDKTHRQFIERVKSGRGDRLKDDPTLFSGMVWNGEQAAELGLIDGFGSPGQVARDVIGVEQVVDLSVGRDPVRELLKRFGTSVGEGLARGLGAPTLPVQ